MTVTSPALRLLRLCLCSSRRLLLLCSACHPSIRPPALPVLDRMLITCSRMTIAYSHTQVTGGPSCSLPLEATVVDKVTVPDTPDVWFVKIVCCVFAHPRLRYSDSCLGYIRKLLTPRIANEVTRRFGDCPEAGFGFFECSRREFGIMHCPMTYDWLMRALCRSGNHDLAARVFDCLRMDGFPIDATRSAFLVSSFVEAGKLSAAKKLLAEVNLLGIKFSAYMYNPLLNLLVNKNQVNEAIALFRDELTALHSGPDTWTFNILIRGLCRIREIDRAFELFSDMKNFGCSPDIITYNTLISGLCRVNEISKGILLLKEVKSLPNITPDVITYTSVISGLCKSGRVKDASVLLDEMISSGIRPNTFSYNVLIDGFGKTGNIVKARAIYDMMAASPGSVPDVITFTSLIDGYCRARQVNDGLKFWPEMISRNISPNIYTFAVVINALSRDNRLSDALEFLRRLVLTNIVPKPFIYNPVIDGLCKAGYLDEANRVAAEMEEKGCRHDKLTFTILIIGHCMKGRMIEAMMIYDKMLRVGCLPDSITVNSLTSLLLKAGMAKEAFHILKAAVEDPKLSISSPKGDVLMRSNADCVVAI